MAQPRMARALEAYRNADVSVGRAAEMAGVRLSEFLDALKRAGIPFQYGARELNEDLAWADDA